MSYDSQLSKCMRLATRCYFSVVVVIFHWIFKKRRVIVILAEKKKMIRVK
jgi:hypothetical protein